MLSSVSQRSTSPCSLLIELILWVIPPSIHLEQMVLQKQSSEIVRSPAQNS